MILKTNFIVKNVVGLVLAFGLGSACFAETPGEIRARVDALEEAGASVQAAELLEAEFEVLHAEIDDERAIFLQLARLIDDAGQRDARIVDLEAQLAENPQDRFARYVLASLYMVREDYAKSAPVFRELVRQEPQNLKTTNMFFRSCLGAGDDCPPLWPEKRADRPKISCEEAIEFSLVASPRSLEPMESGFSFYEMLQDPEKSWGLAAKAYTVAAIVLMQGSGDHLAGAAQGVILYDEIMRCYPNSQGAEYFRERIRSQSLQEVAGEEVFFHDLFFHENLRQNRLDVAWRIKGYDLDFRSYGTEAE